MNKVILINVEHFTPNRDRMFHVSELIADGFNVAVWDVSFYSTRGIDFPDVITASYIKIFNSFEEIKQELDKIDITDTFFIVQVPWGKNTLPFYKELIKRKCYIATFDFYSNVLTLDDYHITINLLQDGIFQTVRNITRKIRNYYNWRKFLYQWRNIKFDCCLSAKDRYDLTGHINHPDYDDFMFKRQEPCLNYPYIVFCDNYFPFHPDLISIADGVDGGKYQHQLSDFFDWVEKESNLPVVIAAHPKAKYEGHEFGGRKIIKLKTNNLVTYSKGVIFHSSNSISYAIMADKEVMCITTDDYNRTDSFESYISALCNYLNIPVYNLNHQNLQDIKFHKIKPEIRNKYIHTFLTSEQTEDKDNFSIIKSHILQASPKK